MHKLCNLHQETPTSGEVWQAPRRRHMLYTSTSDADNGKFGKKAQYSFQQANSQKSHKRQVLVKDCKNYKNCQKIGNTGSVKEATETMKPLQLTNRFQPLDDVCFSQPILTDQTKSILVGKKYGFPLDFDRECPLNSVEANHTSANDNTDHISKFLQEELQYHAILGPFNNKLIDMHISPLLVRDKQNSSAKKDRYGP